MMRVEEEVSGAQMRLLYANEMILSAWYRRLGNPWKGLAFATKLRCGIRMFKRWRKCRHGGHVSGVLVLSVGFFLDVLSCCTVQQHALFFYRPSFSLLAILEPWTSIVLSLFNSHESSLRMRNRWSCAIDYNLHTWLDWLHYYTFFWNGALRTAPSTLSVMCGTFTEHSLEKFEIMSVMYDSVINSGL